MIQDSVRAALAADLIRFEGSIAWPYLDTRGNVTVGVGAMIPSEGRFIALPLTHTSTSASATDEEKSAAWTALKASAFGPTVGAASFSRVTDLRLDDTAVRALLDAHIDEVHAQLASFYKPSEGFSEEFDAMPEGLQLALFDMAFNLGTPKLTRMYAQFNDALKRRDWALAAAQSHRNGISEARNAHARDLIAAVQ